MTEKSRDTPYSKILRRIRRALPSHGTHSEDAINAFEELESLLSETRAHKTAKEQFEELRGGDEADPLERLRAFCSCAMNGQDWLDVEPFFDALKSTDAAPQAQGAIKAQAREKEETERHDSGPAAAASSPSASVASVTIKGYSFPAPMMADRLEHLANHPTAGHEVVGDQSEEWRIAMREAARLLREQEREKEAA